MQDNWVDFKAVETAVTLQMVLDRYGVNWLRKKGEELHGRCPIHQGEGQDIPVRRCRQDRVTFEIDRPRIPRSDGDERIEWFHG
jgi:hypothetical protein